MHSSHGVSLEYARHILLTPGNMYGQKASVHNSRVMFCQTPSSRAIAGPINWAIPVRYQKALMLRTLLNFWNVCEIFRSSFCPGSFQFRISIAICLSLSLKPS
eukprot:Blabericola_migrator_1__4915@NODE_2565_length_2601_cov_5_822810_g1604_i0_p2_GENE_NODE_2565_length_2601_cov_5_822810_g1604_i0NODE_2565_length_2601_cov_5_822810_g1604_i0_p2_ORF_typecomplete_len103_score2_10Axin_bcat_bind/PF08833_10/0_17_NODE_2565_length_2601_cov_5_822810_g1604_i0350658